jgi:hypothetical protein
MAMTRVVRLGWDADMSLGRWPTFEEALSTEIKEEPRSNWIWYKGLINPCARENSPFSSYHLGLNL